jgi:Ser-tRNA(Ala) deacylase AlaX
MYLKDPELDCLDAQIMALVPDGFIPDQTVFCPQSVGQPSDEGSCIWEGKTFELEQVFATSQGLVHRAKHVEFQVGAKVHLRIDPLKRLLRTSLQTAGQWIGLFLEQDGRTRVRKCYCFPQGPYVECASDLDVDRISMRLNEALRQGLQKEDFGTFSCDGTHFKHLAELPSVVICGVRRKEGLIRVYRRLAKNSLVHGGDVSHFLAPKA